MTVDKKIILVTGTTSGIGYETSFTLANASPSNHVIMAARSPSKGQEALKALQARQPAGTLSFQELDLTSDATIDATVKAISSEFGRIDVLVNNAAIADDYPLRTATRPPMKRDEALRLYDTNALGPVLLTQALEPLLRSSTADGGPRIINVSTGLASVGMRADHKDFTAPVMYDAYRMSKAAMNMGMLGFSYYFREWAKVWNFDPGLVVTNLSGPGDHETRKEMGASMPNAPAEAILDIMNGKRDHETSQLINILGGTYPW